jgi:geranylgeranyl transferase type-2 subunit alpha
MRNALWTDASDQSLWFYYQYLMTTLAEPTGHASIVPSLSRGDRVEYISRQLVDLRDMLEDAEPEHRKWICNALFQYTLALCELDERKPDDDEQVDLQTWLGQLRKLDLLRAGRWDDMEDLLNSRGKGHFDDDG